MSPQVCAIPSTYAVENLLPEQQIHGIRYWLKRYELQRRKLELFCTAECLDDSNIPTGDNWNSHLFVLGKSPSEHIAWKMWRFMSFSRWILGSWRCSWEKKKQKNKHEIITFKLLCLGVVPIKLDLGVVYAACRTGAWVYFGRLRFEKEVR